MFPVRALQSTLIPADDSKATEILNRSLISIYKLSERVICPSLSSVQPGDMIFIKLNFLY